MSWEDYCYATHGYFMRQAREREPLRLIATIIFNANVEKKDRVTPEKLMPLFTDKLHKKITNPAHEEELKKRAKENVRKLNEKLAAKYEHGRSNEG